MAVQLLFWARASLSILLLHLLTCCMIVPFIGAAHTLSVCLAGSFLLPVASPCTRQAFWVLTYQVCTYVFAFSFDHGLHLSLFTPRLRLQLMFISFVQRTTVRTSTLLYHFRFELIQQTRLSRCKVDTDPTYRCRSMHLSLLSDVGLTVAN